MVTRKFYRALGDSGRLIALIQERRSKNGLEYFVMQEGKDWHKNDDLAMSRIYGVDPDGDTFNIAEEISSSRARRLVKRFKATF